MTGTTATAPDSRRARLIEEAVLAYQRTARQAEVAEWEIQLLDRTVRCHSTSAQLTQALTVAMGHLHSTSAPTSESQPELDVYLFESTEELAPNWKRHTRSVLVRGDVHHDFGKELSLCYNQTSKVVQLLDLVRGMAFVWLPPDGKLEPWEQAAPLRNLWSNWALSFDAVLLHAGAVQLNTREGVLVTGPGGAGKSTTCAAALRLGAGYLGDDFVLVHPAANRLRVGSLYRTLKLTTYGAGRVMLNKLTAHGIQVATDGDKVALALTDHPMVRKRTACRALVVPVRPANDTSSAKAHLEHGTTVEALKALLPSSLFLVSGHHRRRHQLLRQIASRLPCRRLILSTPHEAAQVMCDDLLPTLTPSHPERDESQPTTTIRRISVLGKGGDHPQPEGAGDDAPL